MIVSVVSEWVVGCFCRGYCMCLCCGVQVFLGVGHVLVLIVRGEGGLRFGIHHQRYRIRRV